MEVSESKRFRVSMGQKYARNAIYIYSWGTRNAYQNADSFGFDENQFVFKASDILSITLPNEWIRISKLFKIHHRNIAKSDCFWLNSAVLLEYFCSYAQSYFSTRKLFVLDYSTNTIGFDDLLTCFLNKELK